jgi:hypothetical protein
MPRKIQLNADFKAATRIIEYFYSNEPAQVKRLLAAEVDSVLVDQLEAVSWPLNLRPLRETDQAQAASRHFLRAPATQPGFGNTHEFGEKRA